MSKFTLPIVLLGLFLVIQAVPAFARSNRTITFHNKCNQNLWIGSLPNPGGHKMVSGGGWFMAEGAKSSVTVADNWAGRFWGRTSCNFNSKGIGSCSSGDCGGKLDCGSAGGKPPATLIEMTFRGNAGQDFYDISLVDGYNLPARMEPTRGTFKANPARGKYYCGAPGCKSDLNLICPKELQKKDSNGRVVGCMSACEKFNTDRHCCRGAYNTPATCPPSNYSQTFKRACPTAYSYAYDDSTSTYTCTQADYTVTFCPQN